MTRRKRKSNSIIKEKTAGTFDIGNEQKFKGEIYLSRRKTNLRIEHDDYISADKLPDRCVVGDLKDGTKVSLILCNSSGTGSVRNKAGHHHFVDIFPHYVLYGQKHLRSSEKLVSSIHFNISDASTLFYDFDAFGSLSGGSDTSHIQKIVEENSKKYDRKITFGSDWLIAYFHGVKKIVEVKTEIGTISVQHNPSYPMGGPDGVSIRNNIFIRIGFEEGKTFLDAMADIFILQRFFEFVIGRKQDISDPILELTEQATILRSYSCMKPKKGKSSRDSHASDTLLDPVRRPDEFCNVLREWISSDKSRRDARIRFYSCFRKEDKYSVDRLIAAANMFDILPQEAVPKEVELSGQLKNARDESQNLWKKFEKCQERDSVLSALGRIGKASLRHKIRHRAAIVNNAKSMFPEIDFVVDEAVICRNHYVHGSDSGFDYNSHFEIVFFFVNTLETIFALSDLIEAGWDVNNWCKNGTVMAHPFAAFRVNYKANLAHLKKTLSASQNE